MTISIQQPSFWNPVWISSHQSLCTVYYLYHHSHHRHCRHQQHHYYLKHFRKGRSPVGKNFSWPKDDPLSRFSGINHASYTLFPQQWFQMIILFWNTAKEYETDQVFVSNLAPTVTEESIKELFGSIGIIKVREETWCVFQ